MGAYFVNGNQNDTHTLMEATVYDIASRTLLFHAPGVDLTRASSSLVYAESKLRENSSASLDRATNDLARNLDAALTRFRQDVKEGRATVKVENRPGYSGAGALDGVSVISGLVGLVGVVLMLRMKEARPHPAGGSGNDAVAA